MQQQTETSKFGRSTFQNTMFSQFTTSKNQPGGRCRRYRTNVNKPKRQEFINITNSDPLQIIPNEVIFKDIQLNYTYEIPILIRNMSKKVRRIRIGNPKTPFFKVTYSMTEARAAGIPMKLLVSFEATKPTKEQEVEGWKDVLTIMSSNNFVEEIPLHAFLPCSVIVFEPFVNLGFVRNNTSKSVEVIFKNEGVVQDEINLDCEGMDGIMADPSFFQLNPKKSKTVCITYTPINAGIFRGTMGVKCQGQSVLKTIDISATSVDYFIFMIDQNGEQQNRINFGEMYFGQQKEYQYYLVNNSPISFKYNVSFQLGHQSDSEFLIQTPNQVGVEQTQKIMQCLPRTGILRSYSKIPIRIVCKTRIIEEHLIWTQNYAISKDEIKPLDAEDKPYEYSAVFQFDADNNKRNQPLIIKLIAKGQCPRVKIENPILTFGQCPVNDHRDITVNLINKADEDMDFSMKRIAHFNATPSRDIIPAQDQGSFIITFRPKNLGTFTRKVDLELLNAHQFKTDQQKVVHQKRDQLLT